MEPLKIDLRGIEFTIGFPCNHTLPTLTAVSLVNTIREFPQITSIIYEIGNSIVQSARDNVVHQFLQNEKSQKLICLDSDMVWKPEDLIKLCGWSTLYPIVAGIYSTKVEGNQKFLGDYKRGESGLVEMNEHGLVKLTALGFGFCIIDRSVFEQMIPTTESYYDNRGIGPIYNFFEVGIKNRNLVGEDIHFFRRWVNEFNGEIWVDPDLEIGHLGSKVYYGGSPRTAIEQFNEHLTLVNNEKLEKKEN